MNDRQTSLEKLYQHVDEMRRAQRHYFHHRDNLAECKELEKTVDRTLLEIRNIDHQRELSI